MGTTKLTRKQILGEDPFHHAIVLSIDLIRTRGRTIALGAVSFLILIIGIYLGLQYLESRDFEAQQQIARGMEFFHARTDPSALDDPYGRGPEPVFRTEEAKYQAAAKQFEEVISKYGSSKTAIVARYYLGLCQMRLGQKVEATRSLEGVRENTKDRTLSYLAKRVLVPWYLEAGNGKAAQELLEGMIRDPQCTLPKEDLKVQLSRAYASQGKRDQALRILREASSEFGRSSLSSTIAQELSRLEASPRP